MLSKSHFFILFLILFTPILTHAQIEGLWLVTDVSIGDQSMTPVAKWTRINTDGTYASGNGWLQNSVGTYTFEDEVFKPLQTDGIRDPFGGFTTKVGQNEMTWTRQEGGATVTVQMKRIEELPQAPADQAVGLWQLARSEGKLMESVFLQDLETMFIRWDHIYVAQGVEDRKTGFWFINAHRPDLTLIPHSEQEGNTFWRVTFEDGQMIWSPIQEGQEQSKLFFRRLDAFPE